MEERSLPNLDGAGAPPSLRLLESRTGDRLVLSAQGEIDVVSAPALRTALQGAAASEAAEVCLDLSRVEFLDSTGLTALVDAGEWLRDRSFAVICPDGPVRRVMAVTGIDRIVTVQATRAS
jgi:anti-sigma B factor antagonist